MSHENGFVSPTRIRGSEFRVNTLNGVVIRKLSPEVETDHIMSDEQLAQSLHILRNDIRLLVPLAVAFSGVESVTDMREFLHESDPEQAQSIHKQYLQKIFVELASNDILRKDGEGMRVKYGVNSSRKGILSQAGHLSEFSRKYDEPLSAIIGTAGGENVDPELFTLHRLQLLRSIQAKRRVAKDTRDLPLSVTSLADELHTSLKQVSRHLSTLAESNIIHFHSGNSHDGGYLKYALTPDYVPDYPPHDEAIALSQNSEKSTKNWVREYALFQFHEDLTVDDAVEYQFKYREDFPLLIDNLKRRIEKSFGELAREGVVKRTDDFIGKQSVIGFTPGTRQIDLVRDYVITLADVQSTNPKTINEGLRLGERNIKDKYIVSHIMKKAIAVNNLKNGKK